nr:alpha/beta hydrolase [Chitinophagaceae bacterium]
LVSLLLLFSFGQVKYAGLTNIIGIASFFLFSLPLIQAWRISTSLAREFDAVFPSAVASVKPPFSFTRIVAGINAPQIHSSSLLYSTKDSLTLDWYAAQKEGDRPCVIVIHGGSWAGGNSNQLPELNTCLARRGYNVASINYRLAPSYTYPASSQDVAAAIQYLKSHAQSLHTDSSNFVLLGRSAGGQIALDAAYSLKDPSVRGVISYYGPTDMVWGYQNPANPLVLDSKKIMEDYLGGTYAQVPKQYVRSSPTASVTKKSVPTLVIQGKNDPLVAYDHCNRLDEQLNRNHVRHFILRLPWATHGCDYTLNGPSGQLCTYATLQFLDNVFTQ